jgi:hypothetical protein
MPATSAGVTLRIPCEPQNCFSLNTCVGNVFVVIQSCDACRVLVHLPHDRAAFALIATDYFFACCPRMKPISHLLSPSPTNRATSKRKSKVETPWSNQLELLTMATHALPASHILDDEDAPGAAALAPSQKPSLMRRLFDAFTEAQMRRAQREVDRILGPRAFQRALLAPLPPDR